MRRASVEKEKGGEMWMAWIACRYRINMRYRDYRRSRHEVKRCGSEPQFESKPTLSCVNVGGRRCVR